jgi:uracil-DNA glycosylase family 4
MSQLSPRSAVFLDEMGIGTRWVLRGGAAPAQPESSDPVAEAVHVEPPAPRARSAVEPAAPAAPVAATAPAKAAGADSMAWFDDAPVPARPATAPAPAPAAARPAASAAAEDDAAWFDDVPAAPAPVRARRESAMPAVSDEEIAAMDWPSLQSAVKSCTRCNLCRTRVAAVPGRGDPQASWIMLATMPTAEDESAIEPVAGEPGILLDNMLRALDRSTAQGAYVTNLVKCRPSNDDGSDRLPSGEELAACRPYLDRELQLAQTRVLVTIGQTAAKGLLGGAARGAIRSYNGAPVVATYHPSDLLRKPEDKGKAWSDLCLAKAAHAGRR